MNKRFDIGRIRKAFDASAIRYDQHSELQREILGECVKLAKNFWQDGAVILDLGTGTGALAERAKKSGLKWDIYGLDLSFDMCNIARTQDIRAVTANADSIPFSEASFDGVFSSLMLQWANDPLAVFKEMLRIVKPGGKCVLSTFIYGTLEELRTAFSTLDNNRHINDFGPPNYFSALAVHAGFRVLSSEETIVTEYYPDVMALMQGLKSIGASTKEGTIRKGMMTPRQLKALEQNYRSRFAHVDGLPATWQVMVLLLEKP